MNDGSSKTPGRQAGVPRDMPDQQADATDRDEEETADDVPGTEEEGSGPRGRTKWEEGPQATPEPHEPTD